MDFTKELAPKDAPATSAVADTTTQVETQQTDTAATDAPAAAAVADQLNTNTTTEQSQQTNNTEAAPPAAVAETATEPDYNTLIDKMSKGKIKDLASFEAILPRIEEYDTLKAERDDLSAKMAKVPVYADDEVRILNELKTAGASKEQIKTFQKINEYGSIKDMPDREARIAKMVMIDGVKPSVAELKVDREYKVNEELSEEDREILDDEMRVSILKDREELEKFKASVSSPNQISPEEAQLQQQTKLAAHQAVVKPYVADVIKSISNMGVFNLSGKEGDEAVNFELGIDDATRAKLGGYVENFFMDGLTPVTPESTREALHYARAEFVRENLGDILKSAFEKGDSIATKRMTDKYENRTGLQTPGDNTVLQTSESAETAAWMQKKVNKT